MKQFLFRVIVLFVAFLPIQMWAQETSGTANGYAWVDLGLSVRWATANVGAIQPYDDGLYFAWGETTGYTSDTSDGHVFSWANYKWCNGSENTQTKYCTDSIYGTVDNKVTLELADDAAAVNMGGNWRMPTGAELEELFEWCTLTWLSAGNADNNGVVGFKMTGPNGNFIILSATGFRYDMSFDTSYGGYWSASLNESKPNSAHFIHLISTGTAYYRY